jgi:hypothetical protein
LDNEQAFLDTIFSKNIIKQFSKKNNGNSERSTYLEANLSDLMNAATINLDKYEKEKNVRLSFFFHNEALKHLARLTRVFVIYLHLKQFLLYSAGLYYFLLI